MLEFQIIDNPHRAVIVQSLEYSEHQYYLLT